jgi:preprotein translocase SecE subunit
VARQTRAQRRARRLAHAGAEPAVAGAGGREGGGKPPVRLAPEPPERPASPGRARQSRGVVGGTTNFVRESVGELRKVEWPGQSQVVQGTVVVIIACVIIGTYLYLADQAFSRFVTNVLLGQ